MHLSCSGVILAGGRSSRFAGENKAFFDLGGSPVIEPVFALFREMFSETLLVTNAPVQYLAWDTAIVTDIFPVKSSLTGIHAGLFYARTPYIFVVACDTPFIRKSVVELVLSEIEPGTAAVMPETPDGTEPLFAAYATETLSVVEHHIRRQRLKIQRAFQKLRVRKIPAERVMEVDPELETFFNINTPGDLEAARARMASGSSATHGRD